MAHSHDSIYTRSSFHRLVETAIGKHLGSEGGNGRPLQTSQIYQNMNDTDQISSTFTKVVFYSGCVRVGDTYPTDCRIPNSSFFTRQLCTTITLSQQATTLRGVWQDKGMLTIARIASRQPAPLKKSTRAVQSNRKTPRSQILLLQKSSSILAENLLFLL